jgi:hypothetical protein
MQDAWPSVRFRGADGSRLQGPRLQAENLPLAGIVVWHSLKSQSTGRSLSSIFFGSRRGDGAGGGRRPVWYDPPTAMPRASGRALAGGKRGGGSQ